MTITLKQSPKQAYAWGELENPERLEVLFGGSGRSGKSFLGAQNHLIKCLEFEGSRWLIGRESLKKLKRTTILTVFEAASKLGLKQGVDYRYNAQENILYVARANGSFEDCSMIFFEELAYLPSDPLFDRLGSYDLTGGWIDEAQEAKKEAKDALQSRYSLLRGKNCDGTEWETTGRTLLTCNPKKNWIYTEFVKPQRDGVLPKDKIFIPALYSDNPFIDQKKYREGILSTKNKILVERLLYGNFDYDDNPEQMMQLDAINDLFTNTFVEKTGQRYISADIALQGADSFVVCVWHGLFLEKIYRIAKTTGAEVEAMIKGIAESERVPQSNIVYDGDGVGAFLGGYLKAARSFINNSAPLSGENYRNLKSQCAFKLAELVNKNEIYIFDDQYREMIIEEMEQIRQIDIDKDGKLAIEGKDKVKERLGRSPDIFDAIMMRMIFEIWKPQTETRSETKKALYSRETVF